MSIIVRDIPMPETCNKCPVEGFEFFDSRNGFANGYFKCNALNKNVEDVMYHGRLPDCPLFELKDWKDL